MDFLMPKKDYDIFCKVAPAELEYPYCLQSSFSLSRIRNSETTGCTYVELNNAIPPVNLGIFIDIFPLTKIPDGSFSRIIHRRRIQLYRIARRGERMLRIAEYHHKKSLKTYLNGKVILFKILSLFHGKGESLPERYMTLCAKYEGTTGHEIGITSFLPYNHRYIWEESWFAGETVKLPFENTEVPVPPRYDDYLRRSFGDYSVPVKNAAQHEMSIMDPDRPYTEYLDDLKSSSNSNK